MTGEGIKTKTQQIFQRLKENKKCQYKFLSMN